jgi:hypothetical protein
MLLISEISGLAFLAGCGGSSAPISSGPSTLPLAVTIGPHPATVQIGAVQQFSAVVSAPFGTNPGGVSQSVVWSVAGPGCSGAGCGTIDATGKYTAPANVPDPAAVGVTATSALDSRWLNTAPIAIVAVAGETFSFAISPSAIAFGDQMVNTTSAAKALTLTNTGSTPQPVYARMNGVNFSDFAETNDCPSRIAVGASCTFTITFRPNARGFRFGILVVDGTFEEQGGLISLTGTGTN